MPLRVSNRPTNRTVTPSPSPCWDGCAERRSIRPRWTTCQRAVGVEIRVVSRHRVEDRRAVGVEQIAGLEDLALEVHELVHLTCRVGIVEVAGHLGGDGERRRHLDGHGEGCAAERAEHFDVPHRAVHDVVRRPRRRCAASSSTDAVANVVDVGERVRRDAGRRPSGGASMRCTHTPSSRSTAAGPIAFVITRDLVTATRQCRGKVAHEAGDASCHVWRCSCS